MTGRHAQTSAPTSVQTSIDELGTPLRDVTFVVVDLETTGGTPSEHAITEIGAVKVRGGQVLGEFQTLVNPGAPIPAFVAVLTGISDHMVASAPRIEAALPAFLEFMAGAVVVAHNARFDTGFLAAACERTGHPWPRPTVLDTVPLARQVFGQEVRNHKLGTLAAHVGSSTVPDHRALHDARATVDVLHALIERVGNLGVTSLEELATYTGRVPAATRRKRHLAHGLPNAPGVYIFRDAAGHPLYVGTSVDIRSRVRSYFTASEQRARMREMVAVAARVDPVVCATVLEARVREIRLIAELAPRYNRRSLAPQQATWVKLTDERFPRLSLVREVRQDGGTYIGPFTSAATAQLAVEAVHEAFPLRQCTRRLPRTPAPGASACLLADIGRCAAPCRDVDAAGTYQDVVEQVRAALSGSPDSLVEAHLARAAALARQQRFEQAGVVRDRLLAFLRGASRAQRLAELAAVPELVAAARTATGGWEFVLVRHGRLAGACTSPRGADPTPFVEALVASGETVQPRPLPHPATYPEETEHIARWLAEPGVRLVRLEGSWHCGVRGAAAVERASSAEPASLGGPTSFAEPGAALSRSA